MILICFVISHKRNRIHEIVILLPGSDSVSLRE